MFTKCRFVAYWHTDLYSADIVCKSCRMFLSSMTTAHSAKVGHKVAKEAENADVRKYFCPGNQLALAVNLHKGTRIDLHRDIVDVVVVVFADFACSFGDGSAIVGLVAVLVVIDLESGCANDELAIRIVGHKLAHRHKRRIALHKVLLNGIVQCRFGGDKVVGLGIAVGRGNVKNIFNLRTEGVLVKFFAPRVDIRLNYNNILRIFLFSVCIVTYGGRNYRDKNEQGRRKSKRQGHHFFFQPNRQHFVQQSIHNQYPSRAAQMSSNFVPLHKHHIVGERIAKHQPRPCNFTVHKQILESHIATDECNKSNLFAAALPQSIYNPHCQCH